MEKRLISGKRLWIAGFKKSSPNMRSQSPIQRYQNQLNYDHNIPGPVGGLRKRVQSLAVLCPHRVPKGFAKK